MDNAIATTVHLDPALRHALELKAAETDCSLSDLVNDAIFAVLAEDAEDLRAVQERAGEPDESFADFVAEIRRSGKI